MLVLEKKAMSWRATPRGSQEGPKAMLTAEVTPWERFCAVVPPSSEKGPEGLT